MLISTSKKSRILRMLITLVLTLVLCTSGLLIIQKPTEVRADTIENSAVLAGGDFYSGWYSKLADPVSNENITSITITTDSSKLTDFSNSKVNIADTTSNNELYYYYKKAEYQVDTDNDGKADTDGYDIVIFANVDKIYAPVNSSQLFGNSAESSNVSKSLYNCKSIIFDNFDTSNVTDMSKIFENCKALTTLNLNNFDTSNVTDMSYMFSCCNSLTSLDLSNFDTGNVTSMGSMFGNCLSLRSLDLSSFNTGKVTDMSGMFTGLQSLKTLDISHFSFALVTDTEGMLGISCSDIGRVLFNLEGDTLKTFVNASTNEERAKIGLKNAGIDETTPNYDAYVEMFAQQIESYILEGASNFSTIIAPNDLNGLEISLPGTYEYTDASGNKISTDVLVEGKTHTLASASSDTNETGIVSDSILLSLIALCFVFSGFVMLKKKKVR